MPILYSKMTLRRICVIFFGLVLLLLGLPASRPAPAAAQGEAEWTIMMYHIADDQTLEEDIMIDLNEAEMVGSTQEVNLVVQSDRYKGAFEGMGDWTGTKRFRLTQDSDLTEINSEELEDLGEVNMADGQSLVDFITWAVANYPARKYALVMSDHGAGWPGGFFDPDPGGPGADDIAMVDAFGGDALWLMEIDRSLEQARTEAGIDQFELVVLDACLMGQLEVFTALAPHARYAVASEEVVPGLGLAYTAALSQLAENPAMNGAELGQALVSDFIDQDQRLLDDTTRAAMYGDNVPADIAVAEISLNITMTAIDLSAIAGVNAALDNMVASLAYADPNAIAEARAYAQPYESPLDGELPSSFIDLGHWAQLVTELTGDPQVGAASDELMAAIQQTVVAEKHGINRPGSNGISIYFPTFETFSVADNFGYTTVAERFVASSRWDDFLAAFYGGDLSASFSRPEEVSPETEATPFPTELEAELPQQPAEIKPLQMEPLNLSAELATNTRPVTLNTQVSGSRLAYVYSFIGRFLPRDNALMIEDMDYLFADENKTVGGVTYPVWPDEGVSVEYEWEPTVYAINDGQTSVRALLRPETYDAEAPVYMAEGIYTFTKTGRSQYARMSFQDGVMVDILGYTNALTEAVGAPREITAQPGDTFTVLERGDDLKLEGEAARESYVREGGTLTFGSEQFTFETTPAPSGNYVVGFIAEDLDGQTYEQYEGLFVNNEDAAAVDGFLPYVNEELEFALLYPEQWQVDDSDPESVAIANETGTAQILINRDSFPDAASAGEANDLALQALVDSLKANTTFENLQFVNEEGEDFTLGAFDAKIIDFSFDMDGTPFYAEAIASTPVDGVTFGVLLLALDSDWDQVVEDFDAALYNFDVLISGVSKEEAGLPAPDFATVDFADDFSDPASGLIQYETEQEWGQGYYSPDETYVFDLQPSPGAIYDYYEDLTLPDSFLLQATAGYGGAADNAYGLVFQVVPGSKSDEFYAFRISGDGFYTVEKTEGGDLVPLIDWTSSDLIDQAEGSQNVLTVAAQAGTYNLYINGQQVDSFTDTDLTGGTIGFMVDNYDETAPASLFFDDLAVGTAVE